MIKKSSEHSHITHQKISEHVLCKPYVNMIFIGKNVVFSQFFSENSLKKLCVYFTFFSD